MFIVAKKQCGGVLHEPVGWFQSFDNDQDHIYDSSLDCIWTLQTSPDQRIVVNFLYFDLKGEDACENGDYLQVRKLHYENMSMQYTAIFHGCKNVHFRMIFF